MRKETIDKLDSYIEELKTLDMETVPMSYFLSVERFGCGLNNGKVIFREKIIKNGKNGNASIILPITENNTTILTIQPRVFTKSTVGVGLPAGYVEENESHLAAAKRELLEETGYEPTEIKEICSFYQDDGCSGAFNKGFLALGCKKVGKQNLDKDEYIKFLECNIEELYELVENGYILDGGSQLLIEKSKKYIKKRG